MASESIQARDLREKSEDEMKQFLREKEEELLKLRFQKAIGQLEKVHMIAAVKREIARAQTVRTERKRAG